MNTQSINNIETTKRSLGNFLFPLLVLLREAAPNYPHNIPKSLSGKDIALHVIQRFQEIVQTGQDFPANGFFFGTYLAADTIPEFLQGNLHLTAATFEGSVLPPAIQGNIPSNFS